MGEKRKIPHTNEFQLIYYIIPTQAGKNNSLPHKCELCIVTCFQRILWRERRKGITFRGEIQQTPPGPADQG